MQQNAVDPNVLDGHGHTALWYAVLKGDDLTKFLLDLFPDIDVNKTQLHGETVLHCAARIRNVEIIKLLLLHGADPSIRNATGKTAEDIARAGTNQ